MLYWGEGAERDEEEALRLLQTASEAGYTPARTFLEELDDR